MEIPDKLKNEKGDFMAKKIYTEEEARERKNARQREYAKRTGVCGEYEIQ